MFFVPQLNDETVTVNQFVSLFVGTTTIVESVTRLDASLVLNAPRLLYFLIENDKEKSVLPSLAWDDSCEEAKTTLGGNQHIIE